MPGRQRIRTRRRLAGMPAPLRALWPQAKRAHTLALGAISPVTRRLSAQLGLALPVRIVDTLEEAQLGGEARILLTRPPQALTRSPPEGIPPQHPALACQAHEAVGRLALAEIPGGRVLGAQRAVLTRSGTLIGELSPYFGIDGPHQHPVFAQLRAPAVLRYAGRVGVLAARGDASYYHYVCDVLPRLALLEGLAQPVERIYMPASLGFQRQLIELVGLDRARIIDANEILHLQAQTLLVPSLPDADLKTPPWIVGFLRKRLLDSAAVPERPWRRIYVTRGARRMSRVVTNETQLMEMLAPLGFEVLDPGSLPVAEQIATFAQAQVVVAPHGAALTNIAFASAGCTLVELFAPDFVQGCYWKLAAAVPGVSYRYLVAHEDRRRPRRRRRMDGVDSDMSIDTRALASLLAQIGCEPAGAQARATIR